MNSIGPGDRVECIRDDWWTHGHQPPTWPCPHKGEICVVIAKTQTTARGTTYVELRGYSCEFTLDWFRPIRDTDIEQFREIVRDVMDKVTA